MTQQAQPTTAGRVRRIAFWIVTGVASAFVLVALLVGGCAGGWAFFLPRSTSDVTLQAARLEG